jgi:ferredoxin
MKKPLVELSDCITCGVCAEVSPEVFRLNDAGYIEIAELDTYPEDEVNETIKYCPTDCINWIEE